MVFVSWQAWDTTRSSVIDRLMTCLQPGWRGCHPLDRLTDLRGLEEGESLLLYRDQHWSALQRRQNCFLYFDPQGDQGEVRELLPSSYLSNPTAVQSSSSQECGLFSMLFIRLVEDVKSYENFLNLFDYPCSLTNDSIARHHFLWSSQPKKMYVSV